MPELNLLGVSVQFPFTPYDSQKDFMSRVIESLQKNQNALLESPTGTGKTLCLLCASLAWLETHQAHQQFLMSQSMSSSEEMQRLEEQLKTGAGPEQFPAGFGRPRVKVIYASRTHTQLSQVMSELKRTSYSGFRTSIIASREQLCIHPTVSKETSNQAKQTACRVYVQTRRCHYYNNVEKKKDLKAFKNPDDPQSNILDIEDLKLLGSKHKCCPYYITRAAAKDYADIIFMPYNYLLDPMIRKRQGIDLNGAVIIFDEAHNLNQVAEECSSVELTAAEVTSAVEEVDAVMTCLENFGKDNLEGDNFQIASGEDSINFDLLTLENVAKVKAVLLDVEQLIANIELSRDKEMKAEGSFMFELLSKAKLEFSTYLPIYEIIDASIGYLTSGGYSGIHAKAFGLSRFSHFLRVVFESDSYNIAQAPEVRKAHISQFYKVYVHDREPPKIPNTKKSFWMSDQPKSPVRVLSFWCFSPGFSMTDLQKQGVRCILLTSGTLKPLKSFSAELRIPFPLSLENPHVISPNQISVSVVKQGPESVILNSNYHNRSDPKYHTSLGYAIMQIAKAVPDGMLVFFPSYYIMRMIIETWTNGHIMQCIQRYKQIFIEPTKKDEFQMAMEQYYAMINDSTANGAIFCGVCRGKVSEGLDFVDKNGRAVVITGIPYAPAKDPKIVMKKSYLDQQLRLRDGKDTLTGNQWYSQQASRAVNQAIGRVIRHRFDYGAILLLDTRFSGFYAQEELPAWVKSQITIHESFSSVIRLLNKFFSTIPALVEERKVAAGVSTEPEKPSGRPRVSLSQYDETPNKAGLRARSIYSDDVAEDLEGKPNTSAASQQPARKKIRMQMVPAMMDSMEMTPPPLTESTLENQNSVLEEKNTPKLVTEHSEKNMERLKVASDALKQSRALLSNEKFVGVKSSLLKYNKSKDINAMESCISILLEQEATHHVIQCFRGLIGCKQLTQFDELESRLRSGRAASVGIVGSQSQSDSSSSSSDSAKSRYAATLSLFSECKRKLKSSQVKTLKSALLSYKNKGSIEELISTIRSVGQEESAVIFSSRLRVALRDSDKVKYDKILSTDPDFKSVSTHEPTTVGGNTSLESSNSTQPMTVRGNTSLESSDSTHCFSTAHDIDNASLPADTVNTTPPSDAVKGGITSNTLPPNGALSAEQVTEDVISPSQPASVSLFSSQSVSVADSWVESNSLSQTESSGPDVIPASDTESR